MTIGNQILIQLRELSSSDVIAIHNEYCEENQQSADIIMEIDDEADIDSKHMASMDDTHYIYSGDGKIQTFSHADDLDSPVDYKALSKWLEQSEKYNDYGIDVKEK